MSTTIGGVVAKHWPWMVGVIFVAGGLYIKVQLVTDKADKNAVVIAAVPLHELRLDSHERRIEEIIRKDAEDNRQFLNKLDTVIQKLEQRDETQTRALTAMQVQIGVIEERSKK